MPFYEIHHPLVEELVRKRNEKYPIVEPEDQEPAELTGWALVLNEYLSSRMQAAAIDKDD